MVHTAITRAVFTVSQEHVMHRVDIVMGAVKLTGQENSATVSFWQTFIIMI
jgi:hypothetical protein